MGDWSFVPLIENSFFVLLSLREFKSDVVAVWQEGSWHIAVGFKYLCKVFCGSVVERDTTWLQINYLLG